MSLFFSFLLLLLRKFRKCPWSTSSDSLRLPACILAMLTPCLLLGLCSYCFFHLKHPSLLFIPILYASAQQALILTSLPLDWTRCSFSGLCHNVTASWVIIHLGVYLLVKTGAWLDLTPCHQSNAAF